MEASDKAVLGPIVNSASTLASKLCNRHRIVFKIIVAFEMAIDPREESIFLARKKKYRKLEAIQDFLVCLKIQDGAVFLSSYPGSNS